MRSQDTRKTCTIPGCNRTHYAHGWCSFHRQRWVKWGDPLAIGNGKNLTPEERFWRSVVKQEHGCWLWSACMDGKGYGTLKVGGQPTKVHRFSYELHYGPIPNGLLVCHICDKNYPVGDSTYRRCVRPDHLFLGTSAENSADMVQKGRAARGERHHQAKLTEDQVLQIRRDYAACPEVMDIIAARYGVTSGAIWFIVKHKAWAHLGQETE